MYTLIHNKLQIFILYQNFKISQWISDNYLKPLYLIYIMSVIRHLFPDRLYCPFTSAKIIANICVILACNLNQSISIDIKIFLNILSVSSTAARFDEVLKRAIVASGFHARHFFCFIFFGRVWKPDATAEYVNLHLFYVKGLPWSSTTAKPKE